MESNILLVMLFNSAKNIYCVEKIRYVHSTYPKSNIWMKFVWIECCMAANDALLILILF